MDSLQSEDFISETVGLLILNELRIMRRDFKAGLIKLETKVDTILSDYDIETVPSSDLNLSKEAAESKDEDELNGDVPASTSSKSIDLSQDKDSKNSDEEIPETAIFDASSNEIYMVKIDVNELPDDISLESFDEEEEMLTLESKTRTKKSKKGSKKKDAKTKFEQEGLNPKMPLIKMTDGRFQCSLCSSSFTNRSNLTRHYRYHTNDKRFACRVCSKKFFRRECLFAHMRRHTNDELSEACHLELNSKLHPCTYCDRSFSLASNLKRHMRLHTGEKPYGCSFCDEKFGRDDTLQRHIKKHHPEVIQQSN